MNLDTDAENKVDDIAGNLYLRICVETEKILREQLGKLGVECDLLDSVDGLEKQWYPEDPYKLESWSYNGVPLLLTYAHPNDMGIGFDINKIEFQGESNA